MKKLLALLFTLLAFPAYATITLDGTPVTNNGSTISQTVTVTTSNANDIIFLEYVDLAASGVGSTVSTITDTAGLTWHLRAGSNFRWGPSSRFDQEEWYAISPGTLSSDVITITSTSAAAYATRVFASAFTGVDQTTPFDTNVSLPCVSNASDSTQNIACTISTTNTNSVLIGFVGGSGGIGTVTRPSGFTNLVTGGTTMDNSYKIVSSAQSSVSESWSWTGTTTARSLTLDALQAASAGTPTSGTLMNSGF